jgi:hypothetical protein
MENFPMPPSPEPENLRVEYQAAQNSAQHHDNLVWSVTSVMWASSLVLMGFILRVIKEASLRGLVTVLSILGIVLMICVWIFALQLNAAKRHKYKRCKEIESILGLSQHRSLEWASGSQRILYGVLMAFFIIAWLAVLWTAWRCI